MIHRPTRIISTNGRLRAGYDAAQITDENRRHWALADSLSADAALSANVRATLRRLSRYEAANNAYARGIVDSLANYVIGTGPVLQIGQPGLGSDIEEAVEKAWNRWARRVNLAEKLWTARVAQAESGEVFLKLITNPVLPGSVKLDIELVEADRVAAPLDAFSDEVVLATDGIRLDEAGNPVEYFVLKQHPGSLFFRGGLSDDFDRVPASQILHLYRPTRPGQHRGVPEIAPALPLFALLRRYTLATLRAAELAASISGVIKTEGAPETDADEVATWDAVEIQRGMLVALPAGYDVQQLEARQPSAQYGEFKREILREIARALSMPYNVAAGDSSDYNYASGRLDHQAFWRFIAVDRERITARILNPLFAEWLREATLVDSTLPPVVRERRGAGLRPRWLFPGFEHVDPAKEATGIALRLKHGLTTLADEYAKQGLDWRVQIEQRAREVEMMRALNVPLPEEKSANRPG